MIEVSTAYQEAISANARELRFKAIIGGVEVTGKYLINATVEEKLNADDAIIGGATCASKLTLNMRIPDPGSATRRLNSTVAVSRGCFCRVGAARVFYVPADGIETKTIIRQLR